MSFCRVTSLSGNRDTEVEFGCRLFRMPAEWETHRATWLVWPHNRSDWEIKTRAAENCFAEIVRTLVESECVAIVFHDEKIAKRAKQLLCSVSVDVAHIETVIARTDRSWIRDSGPIFVSRKSGDDSREVAMTDWKFNGWARYRRWENDNRIPGRLAAHLGCRRFPVLAEVTGGRRRTVLEGGSIDVNGNGVLITTEECLLGKVQERNPGMTRIDMERTLGRYLGVNRVIWLGNGIVGDDTHGHVDNVARFVSRETVVAAYETDNTDANFQPLTENLDCLRSVRTSNGRPLRVVQLPMPKPRYFEGQRLPASYTNFYVSNRAVLVPTFNDPADLEALSILSELFPSRKIVGIYSGDLVVGGGAVHCITQQEPV